MGNEKKLLPFAFIYSALTGFILPLNGLLLSKVITKMTMYLLFSSLTPGLEIVSETKNALMIYILCYFLLAGVSWFSVKNQ
jgi:hypothetical protein